MLNNILNVINLQEDSVIVINLDRYIVFPVVEVLARYLLYHKQVWSHKFDRKGKIIIIRTVEHQAGLGCR